MRFKMGFAVLTSALICSLVLAGGCAAFRGPGYETTVTGASSAPAESTSATANAAATGAESALPGFDMDVIYSLTGAASADGYDVCAGDMYDSLTAEILSVDPVTLEYRVSLYSLETGEMKAVFEDNLTADANYALFPENFVVINESPFIVEDIWADVLYVFSADFSDVQVIDTRTWSASGLRYDDEDHSVYYLNYESYSMQSFDLETQEASDLFTDTLDYQSLWIEGILEESRTAVFSGSRISDGEYINLLADLDTGEVLYEATAGLDYYETAGNIYVIRQNDDHSLSVGLFDEDNLEFDAYCEIELENYYSSSCFDEEEGLLFLCSWEDPSTYSLLCYDLAGKTLLYEDLFDISGYLSVQSSADEAGANGEDPPSESFEEGEEYYDDFIDLRFPGSRPYSKDINGILIAVASMDGLEDIVVWNLEKAGVLNEELSSSAGWADFECSVPAEKVDYGSNSDYADALHEAYGVNVLIGADAVIEFPNYKAEVMEEKSVVHRALSVIEKTLALYPDGFFRQFTDGSIRGINFYLVGAISPVGADSIENPGGFACLTGGIQMIVLNVNDTYVMQQNICHELSHAIDKRIENLGFEAGVPYLDESIWESFNPDGFSYYYSYLNPEGISYEFAGSDEYTSYSNSYWVENDVDSVYFVDVYAKTFPTEDRARLMEMILIEGPVPEYMESEPMQQKIAYYFSAIRETWDTTGWPDVTSWEEALAR